MKSLNIPVSVLNLVPNRQDQIVKDSIDHMVTLAQATEKMGYTRYWIAEHHNMTSVASSATAILINHTLEHTESIRVGSGGIMLPNHSPLVVAEQFGTMATMFPSRVDLGLGRAPGTDGLTANALRRSQHQAVEQFPNEVRDILTYVGPEEIQGPVKAFPGVGTNVPVYILGSSTSSAYLAAELGLPYAFAAHFAPTAMADAFAIYRSRFKPSVYLEKPYTIACVNVVAADSMEEANYLSSSLLQFYRDVFTNKSGPLKPPVENFEQSLTPLEVNLLNSSLSTTFIGDRQNIYEQLMSFQQQFVADEIMAVTYIYDMEKLIRSYEILKEVVDGFNK
ncbi:LLM class flavin-dependent oxidoreductase [Ureibacillus acetophenoni]|uniref:Luciferase family oxidoreductase group 1 n=1 Tax=Ureibacillus acetophenoni TaxID=614649 RepID=A0A285UQR5_9BACL|nr:LLM class flavin-dependent oxidoreductase [Ureibacillus acetophenoni]SOC44159.1 luciferase family oxidoreductase group 1 [Ureibacillus acetophenoni]